MPRHHTHHGGMVYVFPDDFPRRLKRFQKESGLSWEELARRLGTSSYTVWRWHEAGVRPIFRHMMALLELAESLGLGHLFIDWTMAEETGGEPPVPDVPQSNRNTGRQLRSQLG